MDPALSAIFDVLGKLGALGVALYALRESWNQRREAVDAFKELNEEKADLQKASTEVIRQNAVEIALYRAQLNDLKDYIREKIK